MWTNGQRFNIESVFGIYITIANSIKNQSVKHRIHRKIKIEHRATVGVAHQDRVINLSYFRLRNEKLIVKIILAMANRSHNKRVNNRMHDKVKTERTVTTLCCLISDVVMVFTWSRMQICETMLGVVSAVANRLIVNCFIFRKNSKSQIDRTISSIYIFQFKTVNHSAGRLSVKNHKTFKQIINALADCISQICCRLRHNIKFKTDETITAVHALKCL